MRGLELVMHSQMPCLGPISTAEGSALVKIGNTTVMCGIKAVIFELIQILMFYTTLKATHYKACASASDCV